MHIYLYFDVSMRTSLPGSLGSCGRGYFPRIGEENRLYFSTLLSLNPKKVNPEVPPSTCSVFHAFLCENYLLL